MNEAVTKRFLLCFRLTRERVAPVESPSAGGQSILSDM